MRLCAFSLASFLTTLTFGAATNTPYSPQNETQQSIGESTLKRDGSESRRVLHTSRHTDGALDRIDFPDSRYLVFGPKRRNGTYESVILAFGAKVISDFTDSPKNRAKDGQKRFNFDTGEWEPDEEDLAWYKFTLDQDVFGCFGAGGGCPSPKRDCLDKCWADNQLDAETCQGLIGVAAAICYGGIYVRYGLCVRGCNGQ